MTSSEEMEEMGMTISMMGAELLATKKELKGALAALEESQGDIITLKQKVELYEEALMTYKDNRAHMKQLLEESQQRIGKLELYVKSLEFNREDTQKRANEKLRERDTELVEAQQTIDRQREALEFLADDDNWSWCWVGTEDETVTWVGGTDPQQEAREAQGNKKEAAVPVTPNCPTCGNQHPIDHPSRPGIYLCVPCDYVYEEGSDKS